MINIVQKYKNNYLVKIKGKCIASYSIDCYGKYAKALAEKTYITGIRYFNYYVLDDICPDITILKIYSKTYGYFDININTEHFDKVKKYRWHINKDNKTFYCNGKYNGSGKLYALHRVIMQYYGKLQIDHIDRNGLNNLNNNLRIVSRNVNMRNKSHNAKHQIWTNVAIYYPKKANPHFRIIWTTLKGESKYKFYKFNEENYDEMMYKAIYKSITKRALHGYTLTEEDMKFIKDNKLSIIRRW